MKIIVFLFPIILLLIFLCIKLLSPNTYILLIQEDSVIEYAQVLFYFISSILSLLISIKFLKNKLDLLYGFYGILAIVLLLTALEEISWGQRIFNIPTYGYFKPYNVQDEISFHNLIIIQHIIHPIFILIGAYGTFAWLFVRRFEPRAKTKYSHIVNFVVPEWFMSSYFFFVLFIYTLFYFMKPHPGSFLLWKDQEPIELLLSLGFLLFTATNYIKLRIYITDRSIHSCLTSSTR